MKVAVLGSGSRGNSTFVQTGGTCILIDAGFSGRELARRLEILDANPDLIDGIIVTHEHSDHTKGIGLFARRHGSPIYMTSSTHSACSQYFCGGETIVEYDPAYPFTIGDLSIEPFEIIHDAADPVGLALLDESSGLRLGIATDLGRPTAQLRQKLSRCDFLILEANHDEVMLHSSSYPASVRQRISSSHGHLSNQAAARLAIELMHPQLVGIVLAHLSSECNCPNLAKSVIQEALKKSGWSGLLEVALQDHQTALLDIKTLQLQSDTSQLNFL